MGEANGVESIVIRQVRREDIPAVSDMFEELADIQNLPPGPRLPLKELERDCFDVQPAAVMCKVAEDASGELVGLALYFYTYSIRAGRSMMLQALYVKEQRRSQGIGQRLFAAVAKEAVAVGTRLDFHVLDWNPARKFYESNGAVNLSMTEPDRWCYYRLAGDRLQQLADTS